MLLDKVNVTFKAGDGGAGKVSFKKIGRGPDGGNGGDGGDLYIITSSDLTLLNQFSSKDFISAGNGINGANNNRRGTKGQDIFINLPVGTSIINLETNQEVLELKEVGQKIKLLKGGNAGRGNFEFRSARNTSPKKAQKGSLGETLVCTLNLKIIADYGLIGLPNAGKSSLLNELTGTNVKTANYQFTTISPNLGILKSNSSKGNKILADIPGLIEGASLGRGLGIDFLKHIEKVKVLIHCIDSTSTDYKADYMAIRDELGKYNKDLLNKKEIILLTKSDLVDRSPSFSPDNGKKQAIPVSIHDFESIQNLIKILG